MKSPEHLAQVAQLACSVCSIMPVECHHPKGGQFSGTGRKCSDMFVIPLCPRCHQEFHQGGMRSWEMRHRPQVYHLAKTLHTLLYRSAR